MTLISNSYPGRKDGSYSLLFGEEAIGSLISAIHSSSIKMGNELERLIIERSSVITNLDDFFNKSLPDGVYVIPKKLMNDKRLNFEQRPDMLIVDVRRNTCKIIEMKLGDNFDTKKSKGEVDNLSRYKAKLDMAVTYRVSFAICMWYAKTRADVIIGFKNTISMNEAITGAEFCGMVGLNYAEINRIICNDQAENREFLFKMIAGFRNEHQVCTTPRKKGGRE